MTVRESVAVAPGLSVTDSVICKCQASHMRVDERTFAVVPSPKFQAYFVIRPSGSLEGRA